MTDAQTAAGSRQDNFLVAGFRELGRTYTRFTLRQKIRRQGIERKAALAALGQRAWEEKVDLTAFAGLRDRLTGLDVRAGELSQTTSKLESDKAALELERRTALETFSTRRRAIEEKKTPVDTALRAARARKTEREQTIAQSDARIAVLAGQMPPLDSEIAALSALVAPDQPQRLAAAQEKRVRLAAEQANLGPTLVAARAELPGLAAEEHRLVGESQQRAAEIAAVDAEQKAALARIDAGLSKVRSESQGTSQQSNAVRTQRAETFGNLGQGLYDSGVRPPALAEPVERVAAIDKATAETESALGSSTTETQSLARGTMLKFWCVVAGVPLLLVMVGVGTSQFLARRAETAAASVAASAPVSSETERNAIVQRFVQSGAASDQALHASAVRILREDILTMGATADEGHLPVLTKMLHSEEPDLRAAAADAMGMIRPTQSETAELSRLLKDPVARVSDAARRALGESSDPAARTLARSGQSAGKQAP
jgi:predicted  nucleic acid-binding Zn-ribbon protein